MLCNAWFLAVADPNDSEKNAKNLKSMRRFGGLTVKMLRCGRNDPGSTPGRGMKFFFFFILGFVYLQVLFFFFLFSFFSYLI